MNLLKILLPVIPIIFLQACDQSGSLPDVSITDQSTNAPYTILSSTASVRSGSESACPQGGVTIDTGFDSNGNAELETDEVTDTLTICHGADGIDGENGTNGANGLDGVDGLTTLIVIEDELAGNNCLFGGKKIAFGLDENANDTLEVSEIGQTEYFCSVVKTLVNVTFEPWGDNCFFGGDKIETGVDLNADNELSEEEVYDTDYACTVHNRLINTYICRAGLIVQGDLTNILIEYRLDEYYNGEIEATADVVSPDISISKSNHWSPWIENQVTSWTEGLVRINFDMITPANSGYWLVGLDRGENPPLRMDKDLTNIIVEYHDEDIDNENNRLQWEAINFGSCITAMETP
jgi:hypothetical protein